MKKQCMFFMGMVTLASMTIIHAGIPSEDVIKWDKFCSDGMTGGVRGGIIIQSANERQMRDICATNVFSPLSAHGYNTVTFSKPRGTHIPYIQVQVADAIVDKTGIRFEVEYFTSDDKTVGGQMALLCSTLFYSNMGGPLFKQYVDGPGNVCLLPGGADVTKPTEIRDVFFYRDNVAVRVRNLRGGDVLAFAKLLDDCILASSAEEPIKHPPE